MTGAAVGDDLIGRLQVVTALEQNASNLAPVSTGLRGSSTFSDTKSPLATEFIAQPYLLRSCVAFLEHGVAGDTMDVNLEVFAQDNMKRGTRFSAQRLQAALALLEKLRDKPSLVLRDHLTRKGKSGLELHEMFGDRAYHHLELEPVNPNHGHWSSRLQDWGQQLLNIVDAAGFRNASVAERQVLIDSAQYGLAAILRRFLEQDPLEVRIRGRTAESVIREVLTLAGEKGKSGDVAQYLVGACLVLRFDRDIPIISIISTNKADRKSRADRHGCVGGFEVEDTMIEVAIGLPDQGQVAHVAETLRGTRLEVWVLTRADRVAAWKTELGSAKGVDPRRVVVTSIDAFVGQDITESAAFSAKGKYAQLKALFELYNTRWVSRVDTPGIRIEVK